MVDSTGSSPILYFIHTDQIGTPQKITDGSMNIVWDGVFDPFGNSAGGSSLSLTNLRFPGQYFDAETALNQNWNRDYDPTTGRYIQSDPIGLYGGVNTYAYVGNDPLRIIDPWALAAGAPPPGTPVPPADIPGGPWKWYRDTQTPRGGRWMGANGPNGRTICTFSPPGSGNPSGYWKTQVPQGKALPMLEQRYDGAGRPITAPEAHPGSPRPQITPRGPAPASPEPSPSIEGPTGPFEGPFDIWDFPIPIIE